MARMLEGLTALVTGASKGVGKGIASGLAQAGCRVAVNYHSDADGAEQTVAELRALGTEAFGVHADVGVAEDVKAMFNAVLSKFQRLDILVNNAGIQVWKPTLEMAEAEWDRVITTNLKGCFLCMQHAATVMKEHSSGVIVNIGSGSNKMPFPNLSPTLRARDIEMFTKAIQPIKSGPNI